MLTHDLDMIVIPHSSNAKTGDIIQSYSAGYTCPNRCVFKGNGCYADNFHVSQQWERCNDTTDNRYIGNAKDLYLSLLSAVADHVRKGSEVIFRHNIAGDIAHANSNMIDGERLEALYTACKDVSNTLWGVKVMGYTYTHCSVCLQNVKEVEKAGFTVNFSCETVEEVREAKLLDCNAVITSVDPEETIKALHEEGFKAVQCPAQTSNYINCKGCKLCARNREAVVVFAVHGVASKKAKRVIMLKQGKVA